MRLLLNMLSRKQNNNGPAASIMGRLSTFLMVLFVLASCASQRPAVVTVKKRTPETAAATAKADKALVAKAPELKAVKAKPEPRMDSKSKPALASSSPSKEVTEVIKNVDGKAAKTATKKIEEEAALTLGEQAIEAAETYLGTRYRYAGNSYSGIDCSGLMKQAYESAGVEIPRTSGGIMSATDAVLLDHVVPGDFVFFATGRGRARVSHVGLVTRVVDGDVEFIHASSSQGVIKSMLSESYWSNAFLRAGRLEE